MVETRPRTRLLVAVAIVVTGFSLRPAVTSLGALLPEVRAALGISAGLAGVLSALPVLCFATIGAAAPRWRRRLGAPPVLAGASLAVAVGLGVRALAPGTAVFVAGTVLALAGIALANVLLPPLVKEHFPDRVGLVTGVFSVSVSLGVALPAAVSLPFADAVGSDWRAGLGVWSVVAALAVVPWILELRRPDAGDRPRAVRLALHRSPTAWALLAFFGLQSLSAFALMAWLPSVLVDAGVEASAAGGLLALGALVAVPISLAVPVLAGRSTGQRWLVVTVTVPTAMGYAGLLVAPGAVPWLWALLLTTAYGAYPLAVALITLRARDAAATLALSRFAQTGGYLIAALGPLAMGGLHELTGGWSVPLALVLASVGAQLVAGLVAARPRYVEDEVDGPRWPLLDRRRVMTIRP